MKVVGVILKELNEDLVLADNFHASFRLKQKAFNACDNCDGREHKKARW